MLLTFKIKNKMSLTITNEDNMILMARYPDKHFDLAIVDPPYGIDASNDNRFNLKTKEAGSKRNNYTKKNWDNSIPNELYFNELFRVSKNQIIWGANYFGLKGGCLFWLKNKTNYTSSNGEIAFKSFGYGIDYVDILWHGALQKDMNNKEIRIHPTQKPVELYKWILDKYAKQGDKILDTHLGSGSIAIACHDYGFDLTACELDKEYYDKAIERINNHVAQQKLF
jgi:site-specific DNA-methyltransferase (adenine-specific)